MQCHYDTYGYNLVAQLWGSKRWKLSKKVQKKNKFSKKSSLRGCPTVNLLSLVLRIFLSFFFEIFSPFLCLEVLTFFFGILSHVWIFFMSCMRVCFFWCHDVMQQMSLIWLLRVKKCTASNFFFIEKQNVLSLTFEGKKKIISTISQKCPLYSSSI